MTGSPASTPARKPDGPPSSVLRPRVAAAPVEGCPTLADLGLVAAKEAAFEWQTERSRGRWNAIVWPMQDERSGAWIPGIYGLLGTAAEAVLTCIEAASEIEITKRDLAEPTTQPDMHAALSRSLRFFAEGQVNSLTVFGHTVANLTLRTLMLLADFKPVGIYGITLTAFKPQALDKRSWVSLSPKLPRELDDAIAAVATAGAAPLPPEATTLVDGLRTLIGGDWGDLYDHRNDLYHGWRGEADGVTAVNFSARGVRARLDAGEAVSIGTYAEAYVEGRANTDKSLDVAARTMTQVAAWMPGYLAAWADVVNLAHP